MPIATESITALVEQIFALQRAVRVTTSAVSGVLSFPHQAILGLLSRRPGLRLSDCSAVIGVSPSVMSRQIADLLDLGLVDKLKDPDDARVSRMRLTDSGRAALENTRAERAARLRSALGSWTDDDATDVTASLARLVRALTGEQTTNPTPSTLSNTTNGGSTLL